jgi:hypothetical protein
MAQWGTQANNAGNSAIWAVADVNLHVNTANQSRLFNNTTPDAWRNGNVAINEATGQFGISANLLSTTNKAVAGSEGKRVTHTGWNLRTQGTGPVTTITITAGGSGYSNTDKIIISPASANVAAVNATATLTTNATGGVTNVVLTFGGTGFVNNAIAQFKVANSTGGNSAGTAATFTFTVGGRAGRVFYECLVATVGMKGPSGNSTILPG